jgi:hypothetical protein
MGEFKVLLIASNPRNANGLFLTDCKRLFGGYTVGGDCKGVWVDADGVEHRDDVFPVYIATDDTASVVRLCSNYRRDSDEKCVYLKYPNGMVSLIGN